MKNAAVCLITGAVVLTICILIIGLYDMLGLQKWTFVIMLVTMAEIYHLGTEHFLMVSLSGIAGIAVGFSQVLLGLVLPSSLVLAAFLMILVVFVALDVGKNKIVANVLCMINANIILNVPGMASQENMFSIFGGYVLAVVLLAVICYAMKFFAKPTKKAACGTEEQ